MAEDMWQQIEGILWEDSWSLYKEACLKEDWRQAHELLRGIVLKIVESFKQQEQLIEKDDKLIKKYEEAIEKYEQLIEAYEKKIESYEKTAKCLLELVNGRSSEWKGGGGRR